MSGPADSAAEPGFRGALDEQIVVDSFGSPFSDCAVWNFAGAREPREIDQTQ